MFRVYDQLDNGKYMVYNGEEFKIVPKQYFVNIPCCFARLKDPRKRTKYTLRLYHEELQRMSDELSTHLTINGKPFHFTKCKNMNRAVLYVFNALSGFNKDSLQSVDKTEYYWNRRCFNTSIMYGESNETGQYYGYDFEAFYPNLLAGRWNVKTYMPKARGKEYTIRELDFSKSLQPGLYHVKIQCTDSNFRKLFSFSKHNTYTHVSVRHAYDMKLKMFPECTIELVQDGEPNCYLYKPKDMICTNEIFASWNSTLVDLKKKLPENGLVKHLHSALYSLSGEKKHSLRICG